jgi:hypothetical protein
MSLKFILLLSCLALISGSLNMLRSMLYFTNYDLDIKFENDNYSINFKKVTRVYTFKNAKQLYFDIQYEGFISKPSTVRVEVNIS